MRPVRQLVEGPISGPVGERGDCFRACVASVLEIDPTDLPNPHNEDNDPGPWCKAWDSALHSYGIHVIWLNEENVKPWRRSPFPGYWIATVPNGGGAHHSIVMEAHRVVHDPSTISQITSVSPTDIVTAAVLLPLDPAISQPTKETYTREQLLSDEAIEALARSTWNVNGRLKGEPDWGPSFPRDRDTWMDEARRDLTAALDALDKGKGGEDG